LADGAGVPSVRAQRTLVVDSSENPASYPKRKLNFMLRGPSVGSRLQNNSAARSLTPFEAWKLFRIDHFVRAMKVRGPSRAPTYVQRRSYCRPDMQYRGPRNKKDCDHH